MLVLFIFWYNIAMVSSRLVEYVFFFGLLGGVAYIIWKLVAPFAGALALAAIIVTICHPLYRRILKRTPKNNRSLAAFISVLLVVVIVVLPLCILGTFIFREALSVYTLVNSGTQFSFEQSFADIEVFMQTLVPGFNVDLAGYIQQFASFTTSHIGSIFASTASTIFLFFIVLISIFYFFRDGKEFTKYLIQISPLPDSEDEIILHRLAVSIRSVALGTVLVALIQGTLTAIGLSIFGFERAVLWGSIAAIGALIPGIGTTIVFVPAIIYSVVTGSYFIAGGVAVWGILAVGIIDNILGPYLMSRGNKLHPFLILIAVLGGIALFGPIGFILGPVLISLFAVLLELYSTHIATNEPLKNDS
jgi:predicted PurR-regulated permease PerM